MSKSTSSDSDRMADEHVGARIRVRRKALGLTQTDLAAALGITFQQVQKYERGTNRISASKLVATARCLSVSVAWFFEGLEGPASVTPAADPARALVFVTHGPELAALLVTMPTRHRASLLSVARVLAGADRPELADAA